MNIFGESFHPNIKNQVKIRQEKYGSGYISNRTPEEILYLNGNTSWCKLVSGTDIGKTDNTLAKSYVLFNGTAPSVVGPPVLRGGIKTDLDQGIYGAYGIGGTEYSGLVPMPGITHASITHENRGSFRRAEIKIKAFNKEQFNIIDILYLRLGFSVLIEWGHTMYFQNDGTFVKNNSYTLTDDFLNGKYKYTDFLNIIKDYRLKSEGNYDAMFGKVSNFSWSFDKNGTYSIILKLVSMGDVIESLKVNSLTSPTFLLNQEEQQLNTKNTSDIIWLYKDANTLGAWFYQQTESLIDAYNLEEAQKENKPLDVGQFHEIDHSYEDGSWSDYVGLDELSKKEQKLFSESNWPEDAGWECVDSETFFHGDVTVTQVSDSYPYSEISEADEIE